MTDSRSVHTSIPQGEDGEPLMVVTRHVTMVRPELSESQDKAQRQKASARVAYGAVCVANDGFPVPGDICLLVYDLASGNRVWVEGKGLRTDADGWVFLAEAGVLRDTEGTALRVPAGWWMVRPQAAKLSMGRKTFGYYPYRYVW